MAEFAYNDAKNTTIKYTLFESNCRYHPRVSYKKEVDPRSKSKAADKLTKKLRNLMAAYRENLEHAHELQKQTHNKGIKPRSYAPNEKFWLNSKYI